MPMCLNVENQFADNGISLL